MAVSGAVSLLLVVSLCSACLAYDPPCMFMFCGDVISPVCGSDGQTYNSECLMKQQHCWEGDIFVLHDGPCHKT